MSIVKKDGTGVKISLDQVVNFLPTQVYWLDKDMVFLGCNSQQAKLLGLSSAEEIVGKHMFDFQTKENAPQIQAAYENSCQVIRTEKAATFEEIILASDGSRTVFLSQKSPLFDVEGNVIGLLGVSFDITQRKQVAENKDILLEEIISNLPGNVFWKNRQGVYLGCNDNMAKMVNFSSSKDVIGKTLDEIFPDMPEVIRKVLEEDEEIMREDRGRKLEENGLNLKREPAIYLTHKVPLHDRSGKVVGLLGLSFDITARKNAEEEMRIAKEKAEAAYELKVDFIRNMEHDIRTPVSGLFGVVNILMQQEADPEKKEMLEIVAMASQELLNYVNSILTFSKIESESVPVLEKKFVLKNIVESVINLEAVTAIQKKLEFTLNFPENLPLVLIGDAYRLKRVLINLVSNALKFTHQGFVKLSVDMASRENNCVILRFKIEDSGIGIPREKQISIYEKFVRATPANQGIYKGFGLGLRIVKQFVREMEGEIDLKSSEGKGTTFICTFPFKIPLINDVLEEEGVIQDDH